ncbi:hypothetical protein GCM10023178_01880 [Actinomadura luteofluorescens]
MVSGTGATPDDPFDRGCPQKTPERKEAAKRGTGRVLDRLRAMIARTQIWGHMWVVEKRMEGSAAPSTPCFGQSSVMEPVPSLTAGRVSAARTPVAAADRYRP